MEETGPRHEAEAQVKTSVICIVKEIIVLYLITDGPVDMKAVGIVLEGVVLEGVQSASAYVDAKLVAMADVIPDNGYIAAAPKTDARWAILNYIIRGNGIVAIVVKNNPIMQTSIADDIVGDLAIIGSASNNTIACIAEGIV